MCLSIRIHINIYICFVCYVFVYVLPTLSLYSVVVPSLLLYYMHIAHCTECTHYVSHTRNSILDTSWNELKGREYCAHILLFQTIIYIL